MGVRGQRAEQLHYPEPIFLFVWTLNILFAHYKEMFMANQNVAAVRMGVQKGHEMIHIPLEKQTRFYERYTIYRYMALLVPYYNSIY